VITWSVYILHFNTKYKHAGHYLGIAINPLERFKQHCIGQGARLTQIVSNNKIGMQQYVISKHKGFSRTHKEEKRLKRVAHPERICPECKMIKSYLKIWRVYYENNRNESIF